MAWGREWQVRQEVLQQVVDVLRVVPHDLEALLVVLEAAKQFVLEELVYGLRQSMLMRSTREQGREGERGRSRSRRDGVREQQR